MPQRVEWEEGLATGVALVDRQHQALLALCNELADACGRDDEAFDATFGRLRALAHDHFDAEGEPEDREEFDFLVDEIATPEHFDRLELQRFLALWWLGHVRGSVLQR